MTEGNDQVSSSEFEKEHLSLLETIPVPENLRRELVGERFFATIETAAQETIDTENEQGFVIWL